MAFTFIAAAGNNDSAAGTTLDATSSLNVAAGDLLVAWCGHESTNGTFAVAKTTGGNDFTFDAIDELNHSNSDLNASFGYLLSASADASFTARLTTQSKPFRILIVAQFRPDAGEIVTKEARNGQESGSSAVSSGNISPGGDDLAVVGGYKPYGGIALTSEQINGVAATEPTGSPQDLSAIWYRILTVGFTDGAATATVVGGVEHLAAVIAFKAAAGSTTNQEGARFGNDDGSESAHTWAAAQDANITAPAGHVRTVNLIVDATGTLGAKTFKLQYRKVGDADWRDMPLG